MSEIFDDDSLNGRWDDVFEGIGSQIESVENGELSRVWQQPASRGSSDA